MKNEKLTKSEICKESLKYVKGGGHPPFCPRCGNMEWNLIFNHETGQTLGYECSQCSFFVEENY